MEPNLYKRCAPVGVDVSIGKLQEDLFIELTQEGWEHYNSYPRVYLINKGTDKEPMNYFDEEYSGVLFDDTMTVNSFFIAADERTYDGTQGVWKQDVSMIVQEQLDKLYSEGNDRMDEQLVNQIRQAIKARNWDMRLKGVVTGVEKVFKKFNIDYKGMATTDVGNYCVIRIDFTLLYDNTKYSNPIR